MRNLGYLWRITLVLLLLAILVMVLLHFAVPFRRLVLFPWRLLGLAPVILGIVLNILADRSFKTHKTTVTPFEASSVLVTDGVFRLSRHPMYLGMILVLVGIATVLGSASPWIIVVVIAAIFDRVFIRGEEDILEDAFADDFRKYRKQVRKWI